MPKDNDEPEESMEPLTPEAETLYRAFRKKYKKLQRKISNVSLLVLVWGPGSSGNDLYEKRLQILNSLRKKGHGAFFSEEIDERDPAPELPSNIREMLQAQAAELIVVLQASYGSTGEVHDIAHFIEELGSKMLICINEHHDKGYSYTGVLAMLGARYNNVLTYKYPDDIQQCHLLGAVEKQVRLRQIAKYMQSLR